MERELTQEELHQVVDRFLRISHLHHGVCESMIGTIGVHRSQHMILMQLAKGDKIVSQKELADRFGISPAAVTVNMQKLEKAGYITRASSALDNRFNEVRITESGKAVVCQSRKIFSGIDAVMLQGFSREELEQMKTCFRRMQENLEGLENRTPEDLQSVHGCTGGAEN